MTHRLKLGSRNVYHCGKFRQLEVGIDDGRITEVGERVGRAREDRDLGDRLLLPGMIDGHVHFRDPGNPEKEDFRTGSKAAIRGGVTTIVDMPNNEPPVKYPDLFRRKKQIARGKSLCNYGLYAGIPENLDLIEPLWSEGALGFKHYMAQEDVSLKALAAEIDKIGALLTVHAEEKELIVSSARSNTPEQYLDCRPASVEKAAVKRLTSNHTERLHLAHVTLPESVSLAENIATIEVTPHHLLLAREEIDLFDFVPVCHPPIRKRSAVNQIQELFLSDRIDIIASDHAPHERSAKITDDPDQGSAGIPGVETILPLSLTFARNEEVSLGFVIEELTKQPAQVFGFEKRGQIRKGYWADFVVVDHDVNRKIKGDNFLSKAKLTPFEGFEILFRPVMTFVNGRLQYREGEIIDETAGEFLRDGYCG